LSLLGTQERVSVFLATIAMRLSIGFAVLLLVAMGATASKQHNQFLSTCPTIACSSLKLKLKPNTSGCYCVLLAETAFQVQQCYLFLAAPCRV